MSQKPHDRTLAIDRSSLDAGRFRKEHAALVVLQGAEIGRNFRMRRRPMIIGRGSGAEIRHGRDIVSLVRRADLALYRAKEGGRNRTCIETED